MDLIKAQFGRRYHPVKWRPGVQVDPINAEDRIPPVYYMDRTYNYTYR